MNDEDKLQRAINEAHHAARLLEDELLNKTFAKLHAQYSEHWRRSLKLVDREMCWHRINALANVQEDLATVLANGKLAQADLKMRFERNPRG